MTEKLEFIPPTVMTVLDFFLSDPMNEYHGRQVIRKTGVSKGSAGKILKLLTKLEFLTREERGRMLIYRLNLEEPTVRQFKVLASVFMLKELVDKLRNHSRKIYLFGSCSQGTDVKESDIDLLVVTSEKEIVRKTISGFNRKNERKIVPIIVNMNEFIELKRQDKPLHENVERGI